LLRESVRRSEGIGHGPDEYVLEFAFRIQRLHWGGHVDCALTTPLKGTNEITPLHHEMMCRGGGGSRAKLYTEFLDNRTTTVAVDENGDGVFVDLGGLAWRSLAGDAFYTSQRGRLVEWGALPTLDGIALNLAKGLSQIQAAHGSNIKYAWRPPVDHRFRPRAGQACVA
jgi:hypothetical protein